MGLLGLAEADCMSSNKEDKARRHRESQARKEQGQLFALAYESFFEICAPYVDATELEEFRAGADEYGFDFAIAELASSQTEITPTLRKAIDKVIEAEEVAHKDWIAGPCAGRSVSLRDLNYSDYWREQYGL